MGSRNLDGNLRHIDSDTVPVVSNLAGDIRVHCRYSAVAWRGLAYAPENRLQHSRRTCW